MRLIKIFGNTVFLASVLSASALSQAATAAEMDPVWAAEAVNYYNEQIPDGFREDEVYCIYQYSDDYRGRFLWNAYGNELELEYETGDDDHLYITYDAETGEVDVDLEIDYEDGTSFQIYEYDLGWSDINGIITEPSEETPDVLIMYARFLDLADSAMRQVPGGKGLTDFGLELPADSDIAPEQVMSNEHPFLSNEHHFENGKCTDQDCEVTWLEYVDEGVKELNRSQLDEYYGFVGMSSEYFIDSSDMITYYGGKQGLIINYSTLYIKEALDGNIIQDFTMEFPDPDLVRVTFNYKDIFEIERPDGETVTCDCTCSLIVTAAPDQTAAVCSSPEELMNYSTFSMDYRLGEALELEDEVQTMEDFCERFEYTPITQEELCDVLAAECPNFFLAIDKSLIELGTSLTEAGFDEPCLI